jgi:uncharacterized protein YegP (UPF0339 family)
MGFFDWLFKKRRDKLGHDDGQAKYFKEDFDPRDGETKHKKRKEKSEVKPTKTLSKTKAEAKSTAANQEITQEPAEVNDSKTVKESKATPNGRFDIKKAKDGRYFFSLYASNHTVIAYSQVYSSTTAVTTGINSVITNAPKCEIEDTTLKKPVTLPCPKWEIYLDKAGEYRFRLYAPNGLVVCHAAHGYASKSGCKGGIESIKRFCVEARVDKSYLK